MFAVCIFSYNRGLFLQNAINSVTCCLPYADLYIIDDASDDALTKSILDKNKKNATVLVPSSAPTDYNTGGLYPNMNFAFNKMEERQIRFALCLQDDQQIIRNVSFSEIQTMLPFFDIPEASFVLATYFFKSNFGLKGEKIEPMGNFLCRTSEQLIKNPSKLISFSAVGLFDIERLRETAGSLRGSEHENEQQNRSLGLRLGFVHDPFMHWLPFPVSYLGKRRRVDRRLADLLAGAGVHKISFMTDQDVEALKNRAPFTPAYAEDWLRAPSLPPHKHWTTMAGYNNLLARGGWREQLAKLIIRLFSVIDKLRIFRRGNVSWRR